jgi:hypothetical protein
MDFVENLPLGNPASEGLDRWLLVETFEGYQNLLR